MFKRKFAFFPTKFSQNLFQPCNFVAYFLLTLSADKVLDMRVYGVRSVLSKVSYVNVDCSCCVWYVGGVLN